VLSGIDRRRPAFDIESGPHLLQPEQLTPVADCNRHPSDRLGTVWPRLKFIPLERKILSADSPRTP